MSRQENPAAEPTRRPRGRPRVTTPDQYSPGLPRDHPMQSLPPTARSILEAARRVLAERGLEGLDDRSSRQRGQRQPYAHPLPFRQPRRSRRHPLRLALPRPRGVGLRARRTGRQPAHLPRLDQARSRRRAVAARLLRAHRGGAARARAGAAHRHALRRLSRAHPGDGRRERAGRRRRGRRARAIHRRRDRAVHRAVIATRATRPGPTNAASWPP